MDDMHKCLGRPGSPSPEEQTEVGPLPARVEDQTEVGPLRARVEDQTEVVTLRARVEEQSGLIGVLKQRSDQARLRCQALQKVNDELEARVAAEQKELDSERGKARLLEKRFNDLFVNHQGIIVFKDDYKRHNLQLLEENKLLRTKLYSLYIR